MELRASYRKVNPLVSFSARGAREPDVLPEAKLLMLEIVGVDPKKAGQLAGRTKEEALSGIRKRLGVRAVDPPTTAPTPDPQLVPGGSDL